MRLFRWIFFVAGLFLLMWNAKQFSQGSQSLWVSSDFHIHGSPLDTPATIMTQMESAKINVGHALVWGKNRTRATQYFRGQQNDPVSMPNHILHWDIEISLLPGYNNGHMIMLNLADPDAITSRRVGYPGRDFLLPNYDYVQIPRGILGYTHGQNWVLGSYGYPDRKNSEPKELPLDIILKKVDFLGTENVASGASFYWLWYQMLDAGFHLAPVAGSDYPDQPIGNVHTAVLLQPGLPLTFQNHIDAVSAGRTVIKNKKPALADYLDLQVNGAALGSEINLPLGTSTVTVTVTTKSTASENVEIIVNGAVASTIPVSSTLTSTTVPLSINKSSWIAARTVQTASPPQYQAHTAATFVLVDGLAIRNDPAAALSWSNYLEQYYLYGITEKTDEGRIIFGDSAPLVRQNVDQAKAVWQQIASQGMR